MSARRASSARRRSSASTASTTSNCTSCRSSTPPNCGTQLRPRDLHRRAASPARPRPGLAGVARRAGARRRDAPDGLRALRPRRRVPAAGLLPPAGHRHHGVRRSATSRPACARCRRTTRCGRCCAMRPISATKPAWPTHCCTRRTARIRCRSCSISSAAAGLEFGRWVRQAAYLPQCGALASSPHQRAADAPARARAVRRGGAVPRHDGAAQRRGLPARPAASPRRRTSTARPGSTTCRVRLPDTVVVQERLPPGAAAVLINKTHTYSDIYLPISAAQKRMFDAIDGQRTIAQIAPQAGAARRRAGAVRGTVVVRPGRVRRVARPSLGATGRPARSHPVAATRKANTKGWTDEGLADGHRRQHDPDHSCDGAAGRRLRDGAGLRAERSRDVRPLTDGPPVPPRVRSICALAGGRADFPARPPTSSRRPSRRAGRRSGIWPRFR